MSTNKLSVRKVYGWRVIDDKGAVRKVVFVWSCFGGKGYRVGVTIDGVCRSSPYDFDAAKGKLNCYLAITHECAQALIGIRRVLSPKEKADARTRHTRT